MRDWCLDAPEILPYPAVSFLYITSLSPSSAINRWMLFWNNQQHALVLSLCFKKMKLQISRFHSFPCHLKRISQICLCGSRLAQCSLPPTALLRDRHSEQNWGHGVSEMERFLFISHTGKQREAPRAAPNPRACRGNWGAIHSPG